MQFTNINMHMYIYVCVYIYIDRYIYVSNLYQKYFKTLLFNDLEHWHKLRAY